jgi:hypothetical protein
VFVGLAFSITGFASLLHPTKTKSPAAMSGRNFPFERDELRTEADLFTKFGPVGSSKDRWRLPTTGRSDHRVRSSNSFQGLPSQ